jgi:RNA polymerase sigma-70 factor (ECF subfamily)
MSTAVLQSDVELMLLVRESDAAAFEELLRRHRQSLTAFFRKLCRDADFAEDLFQETFLRIWTSRERYEPTARFASYLYTVARNVWANERERRGRRPAEVGAEASSDPGRPSALELARADERQLPQAVLEERERRRRFDRCLDRLDERLQLVFVLSQFGGLKYADIARQLGIPVGTVKYRMFQAVRELRAMLNEDGEF